MELLAQLLIVLAIILGWLLGRFGPGGKRPGGAVQDSAVHIPAGVRFTFENYSDDAIEKYVNGLEVSGKTLPLHLSIASHFRKKGEVERAIVIHQNLLAHPLLEADRREGVTFELAQDFMSAGLLDRAESLARQLEKSPAWGARSLRLLLDIYQDEKDWAEAKRAALKLDHRKDPIIQKRLAHYCCEEAYLNQRRGDWQDARDRLKEAQGYDSSCVRVSFMMARMHERVGNYQDAINALLRVKDQDPRFLPETVGALVDFHRKLGQELKLQRDLVSIIELSGSSLAVIAYADSLHQSFGIEQAETFLKEVLEKQPSVKVLEYYLGLQSLRPGFVEPGTLAVGKQVFEKLLLNKPLYLCESCGFSVRTLLWLCPSCRQWETIKPVRGVEGI